MRRELPGVRHNRPNFQLDANARCTRAFRETRGIVPQSFIRADMNQKRRKAREIGIERRSDRVTRIHLTQIIARARADVRPMEHGAAVGIRADRVARRGEIGPRRKKGGSRRKRIPFIAKRKEEREREAAAGGISTDNNLLWRISFGEETAISGYRVVNCSWKLIFWRETIVRSKNTESLTRKRYRNRPVRLRRTSEIAAAV